MKILICIIASFLAINVDAQFKNRLPVPKPNDLADIATVYPRPGGIRPLLPKIDLSDLLPAPGMQGYTQGSCAAWTVGYGMMTYLKFKQQRWPLMNRGRRVDEHIYSPSFLYNHNTIDPNCVIGIYMKDALQYSIDNGALTLTDFNYNPDRCDRKATEDQLKKAKNVRLLSFNKLFFAFEAPLGRLIDPVSVKRQLNDSLPVAIGVHLDKSFLNDNYGNRTPGARRPYIWDRFLNDLPIDSAYHAMLCVGYNDTLRAFKVMNSWDVGFGDDGFVWISERVFQETVKEAYTAILPPPRARLVPLRTEEGDSASTEESITFNLITDTNWIKKGYYRDYDDLRVGCLDFDRGKGTAVIRLTNIRENKIITTTVLKTNDEEYQQYEFKGRLINIRLVKIDKAGRNPFKKAAFYELRYTNISGNSFDRN